MASLPVSAEGDLRRGGWSADTPRPGPGTVPECLPSAANFPGVAHRALEVSQAPAQDGAPQRSPRTSASRWPPADPDPRPGAPAPSAPPAGSVSVPGRPRHSPHGSALPRQLAAGATSGEVGRTLARRRRSAPNRPGPARLSRGGTATPTHAGLSPPRGRASCASPHTSRCSGL